MKKLIKLTGLCMALVLGLALTAQAEKGEGEGKRPGGPGGKGGARPDPAQIFAKLDADSSGGISLDEFKNGPMAKRAKDPSMVEKRFQALDADGNGQVSQAEFAEGMKKMRGTRAGGDGGKRPGGEGKKRPDAGGDTL